MAGTNPVQAIDERLIATTSCPPALAHHYLLLGQSQDTSHRRCLIRIEGLKTWIFRSGACALRVIWSQSLWVMHSMPVSGLRIFHPSTHRSITWADSFWICEVKALKKILHDIRVHKVGGPVQTARVCLIIRDNTGTMHPSAYRSYKHASATSGSGG